jgi:hypothetical protein
MMTRLLIACGLMFVSIAHAGLTLTISPSVQKAERGIEIVFRGTLTNTSPTQKLYLNDIALTAEPSALTLQANAFFANVPGILLPSESYTDDELFRVVLDAGATPDTYAGTVIIRGGSSINANDDLATGTATLQDTAFDLWRWQQFGAQYTSNAAAFDADFDHDGADNLVEYALGLDPMASSSATLPSAVLLSNHLTLSFLPDSLASGVALSVEASTDLATWSTSNVEDVTPLNPIPPGLKRYRYAPAIGSIGQAFLRLRADLAP